MQPKNRDQARIRGMVEQVREMARESFGLLQVKIMITANDRSGKATIRKQARKLGSHTAHD